MQMAKVLAMISCGVLLSIVMFVSSAKSMGRDAALAQSLKRNGVRVEMLVAARRQVEVTGRTPGRNTQGYSCMLRLIEQPLHNSRIEIEHEHPTECRFAPAEGAHLSLVHRPANIREYMLADELAQRDERGRVANERLQQIVASLFAGAFGLVAGFFVFLHKR
jgi:hypothetical protein